MKKKLDLKFFCKNKNNNNQAKRFQKFKKINSNNIIKRNLLKYNNNKFLYNYNIKKINSLIYDIKNHYSSKFREFLFLNDNIEFLKKYYFSNEILIKLTNYIQSITNFYSKIKLFKFYLLIDGDCNNLILKYYKLKEKILFEDLIKKNIDLIFQNNKNEMNFDIKNNFILNDLDSSKENKKNENTRTTRTSSLKEIFKSRNEIKEIKNECILNFSYDETIKSLIKNLSPKKDSKNKLIYNKKDIFEIKNNSFFKSILFKSKKINKQNSVIKKSSLNILNSFSKINNIINDKNKIFTPNKKVKNFNFLITNSKQNKFNKISKINHSNSCKSICKTEKNHNIFNKKIRNFSSDKSTNKNSYNLLANNSKRKLNNVENNFLNYNFLNKRYLKKNSKNCSSQSILSNQLLTEIINKKIKNINNNNNNNNNTNSFSINNSNNNIYLYKKNNLCKKHLKII